tara:strand:- start:1236 stop:1406 length:171 start_codon:yes stop_codon:yes gene_type:complete
VINAKTMRIGILKLNMKFANFSPKLFFFVKILKKANLNEKVSLITYKVKVIKLFFQ